MNILCIYKCWSKGDTPYVADALIDGELACDGGLLFDRWPSAQEIIDEVNSPYYPTKIDLIVLGLTARNAIHWNEDFTNHDDDKIITTQQISLKDYCKSTAA